MSAAAGTSMLNYNSKRQPALSATMERVKIPPQNGTIFEMGSTIDIRLPNMPHGNFLDFHNSYLKLNIETSCSVTGAVAGSGSGDTAIAAQDAKVEAVNKLFLPQNGVYGGLMQRVEIISAAQTISVLDEYSKLTNLFISSESGAHFKQGVGSVQYGMGGDATSNVERGAILTFDSPAGLDGASTSNVQQNFFCFGLLLTNLMSSSKYLPLFSSDNIIIRLTLNTTDKAFVSGASTASTTTEVSVKNVEMVNQIVKLDPMAAKLVDDSVGGRYEVVVDDWRNAKSQIAKANTTMNVNLGYSFASLSRVIFAFYKNDYGSGIVRDIDVENNRSTRNLSEYSLQLNGVNIPAQRIKADTKSNLSEVMAEIRGSTRQSLDFTQLSDITKANFQVDGGTGKGATTNIGTAFYEIDTEGLRNYDNEDGVYSGVYTVGSVTSLDATMSGAGACATELNVWGQFQATLSLDTRGDNIFTYRS